MSRLNLLYVTDSTEIGGAESYLLTLLTQADRDRYAVGLLLPPRPATRPLAEAAQAAGATSHFFDLPHQPGLRPAAIWRSWRVFRQLRPDIVHFVLGSPRRCAELIIGAALAGVPRRLATFQLVTPVPRFGWLAGWLRSVNRRSQYRLLHAGVAVSEGNARLLRDQYRFPAPLTIIPNGIDPERWRPGPRDPAIRAAWGVPADAPLLGVVGRLSPQKGHRILLSALPAIWQAFPDTHVVFIGQGELETELRALAADIDPLGRIHFAGQRSDLPRCLPELDIFVLPSLYEGLSFAVLEALAAGCAVAGSAVDGTREVIEDGRTGRLVPPGDPGQLAQAVLDLLGDPESRRRMGQAASALVAARFTQAAMLSQTFALYERPGR